MHFKHLACAAAIALMSACGGGGGSGGGGNPPLLPALDPTYRTSGAAAAGAVFVHLFEWRWSDIAQECETTLGPAGFSAVQISPPSEHALIVNAGGSGVSYPWWQRYQTVSYKLDASRSGTLAEFRDMVARCKAAGVGIYADAVINHMAAGAGTGSAGSAYSKTSYGAVPWSAPDFHAACSINSYGDAAQVQLCELAGLADLRTEDEAVRDRIAQYLISLHAEGVAGFRIDAAKHMQPRDIDAIVARLNAAADVAGRARPYVFLEVINNGGEAITAQQYYGVGYASGGAVDVTDFQFGYRVSDAFLGRGGATLASLATAAGSVPADKSVVFVDNHDNQRADNLYHAHAGYEQAQIFALAQPQGVVSVMSSYGFNRASQAGRDAGPPGSGGITQSTYSAPGTSRCTATLGAAQVGSWICEHRVPAIAAMPAFRKAAAGAAMTGFTTIGADNQRIAFAREGKGYVALSRSGAGVTYTAQTTLPDGQYCNVAIDRFTPAAGATPAGCSGMPIGVAGGSAAITLPAGGSVVLHVGARL
ncbi:alpha-amylase [Caldimonas sp. KR1-144]|uniref:alpha-amylase n=1 Tax=Caldimonas sp. KR1-144 TaxID=3400911 RepID=UPI003C0C0314